MQCSHTRAGKTGRKDTETITRRSKHRAVSEPLGLVNRNISTVVHNLIEGAIIVFVVLIIFLGNIRAGLIVASVIPLAMLFAFILMRIFGVTANLMSSALLISVS